MRQIMEHLLAPQRLECDTKPLTLDRKTEILKMRAKVPAPILVHFDRVIARGKKGGAVARNDACSQCHFRLPSGTMAALARTSEVHICANCGRYLYLAEDEPPGLTDPPAPIKVPVRPRARRTRQKADLHAA